MMGRWGAAVLTSALGLGLWGCGAPASPAAPVGTSTVHEPRGARPIELTVRTTDGTLLSLGALRGDPVLLFLFATFDGVSQAALRPLGRFVREHPDVHVLGVAVQPAPDRLVEAWQHALDPPFRLGYAPDDRLRDGTSSLGPIEQIPTFVMLDRRGRIVDRHVGFASTRDLGRMLRLADRGRRARRPPS